MPSAWVLKPSAQAPTTSNTGMQNRRLAVAQPVSVAPPRRALRLRLAPVHSSASGSVMLAK
ncbi:hypothetical protein D3C77_572740 [compost metagenome]